MLEEGTQILKALTQWRQGHAHRCEAVIEVETKCACVHPSTQIAMRRRDDAHVDIDEPMAADAVEAPSLEHTQQHRLVLCRELTDLIEKERAAIGLLERTNATSIGARECPALMAKELARDELWRDRSAVDRHKGLIGARAPVVNRARRDFLACARLAMEQHGDIALRHARQISERLLHRG